MNLIYVSLKDDFSDTPGARFARQGQHSAEEFFTETLAPSYEKARAEDADLLLDLDGTAGIASSFLDEICLRLVSRFGPRDIKDRIMIITSEEPYLAREMDHYLSDAAERSQ